MGRRFKKCEKIYDNCPAVLLSLRFRHPAYQIKDLILYQSRRTVGTGKGKGKGSAKGKNPAATANDSDESCTMCNGHNVNGEDWITCDICNLLYHSKCVNIHDEEEWCGVNEGIFSCPFCQ